MRRERNDTMWEELGISGGTAILILIALYFVVKWAGKNGIEEAYRDITGKKTKTDEELEKITASYTKSNNKEKNNET